MIYKKQINDEMFTKMKKDHYYYVAYNKTISYIMKHQRFTSEINKYLEKFELSEIIQESIIQHLKDIGLLNGEVYIKSYIADSIFFQRMAHIR